MKRSWYINASALEQAAVDLNFDEDVIEVTEVRLWKRRRPKKGGAKCEKDIRNASAECERVYHCGGLNFWVAGEDRVLYVVPAK